MKIAIVFGTRPEIIKLSPLMRLFKDKQIEAVNIHTGQHYDYEMDKQFFEDLNLDAPKYNLGVGGKPYNIQISSLVREIEKIIKDEEISVVIVQGDTNSVIAGTLAAVKSGIPVAHLEAGLRSHDIKMLEEVNRTLTDQISTYLFAPTQATVQNLIDEGINQDKVFLTGNSIVDAVTQNSVIASNKSKIVDQLSLTKKGYILATIHRAESVDDKDRLASVVRGLDLISQQINKQMVWPMHPRTKNKLEQFNISVPANIKITKPLGYLDFLELINQAQLIVTDSGGIQEEACLLKVPCVTVRQNTERPETVDLGMNILAGTDSQDILKAAEIMIKKEIEWQNPFGDGTTAEQILKILQP